MRYPSICPSYAPFFTAAGFLFPVPIRLLNGDRIVCTIYPFSVPSQAAEAEFTRHALRFRRLYQRCCVEGARYFRKLLTEVEVEQMAADYEVDTDWTVEIAAD